MKFILFKRVIEVSWSGPCLTSFYTRILRNCFQVSRWVISECLSPLANTHHTHTYNHTVHMQVATCIKQMYVDSTYVQDTLYIHNLQSKHIWCTYNIHNIHTAQTIHNMHMHHINVNSKYTKQTHTAYTHNTRCAHTSWPPLTPLPSNDDLSSQFNVTSAEPFYGQVSTWWNFHLLWLFLQDREKERIYFQLLVDSSNTHKS